MSNRFTVPLLGVSSVHTKETKEIYSKIESRRALDFTRQAIISLATEKGYWRQFPADGLKPDYVPKSIWEELTEAKMKSERTDYSYVTAFYWLKSLSEFKPCSKSRLVRLAITRYADQVGL